MAALAVLTAAPAVLLLVVACSAALASGGSIVGPGTVASYQGPSHGRRYGGSVRVTEPAKGFFVAGSSIRELNGLYARKSPEDAPDKVRHHTIQWLYVHDYTGWSLAYVDAPAAVAAASGKSTEWLLIDNDGVDRFHHDGGTIAIGSGSKHWSHVHRTENVEPNPKVGAAVAEVAEDDEEEYPWQVVGIGSDDMFQRLQNHFKHYKHTVQKSIAGTDLPTMPSSGSSDMKPPEDLEVSELLEQRGEELCLPDSTADIAAELERVKSNDWAQAVLHLRTAMCYRLQRDFVHAESLLNKATEIFPRYVEALFERAKLRMDMAQYKMAVTAFELVLRIDREWPGLDAWLVRANANLKREETAKEENGPSESEKHETEHCVAWRHTSGCVPTGPRLSSGDLPCDAEVKSGVAGYCECKSEGVDEALAMKVGCGHPPFRCSDACSVEFGKTKGWMPSDVQPPSDSCKLRADGSSPDWCSPNHYAVLGIPCDLPWPEEGVENEVMKRAYKRRSLQVHPDKSGGSTRAFQRVAAAHETLSDPEKRTAFDEGAEFERGTNTDGTLGPTYRDKIVNEYFPERFDFAPFGDPHNDRREQEAYEQRAVEYKRQRDLDRQRQDGLMDSSVEQRREQMHARAKEIAKERVRAARKASAEHDAKAKAAEAAEAAEDATAAKVVEETAQRGNEKPERPSNKPNAHYRPGPDQREAAGWGRKKQEQEKQEL